MNKMLAALTTTATVLIVSAPIAAHHSLAQFELTTPIRMTGTVVRFDRVNPHSLIFIDQAMEDGATQRWAIDGPGASQLLRMGVALDFLKTGEVIEVCGFAMKEGDASRRSLDKLQARILNGHLLIMQDGTKWLWSDYGQFDRCLKPGESRQDFMRRSGK
jgi:hypothetical protein